MTDTTTCEGSWLPNGTCAICKSLNPDLVMDWIEAGNVKLGESRDPELVYIILLDAERRPVKMDNFRFRFWHLSPVQKARFRELYLAGSIPSKGGFGVGELPEFLK